MKRVMLRRKKCALFEAGDAHDVSAARCKMMRRTTRVVQ